MSNQKVTCSKWMDAPRVTVYDNETTVHWKVRTPGCMSIIFTGSPVAGGFLNIDAREWYTADNGRDVEKRVMLSLSVESQRALFELLRENLEG